MLSWAALRSDWWVGSALRLVLVVYGLARWSMGAALSIWPARGHKWPEGEWL